MKPLFVCALLLIPGVAWGQSTNVRAVTATVMEEVCAPFAATRDTEAAIAAAEALGYTLDAVWPARDERHEPARAAVLSRMHEGSIQISLQYGTGFCALGLHEGSVGTMTTAAEPFLRALDLEPVVDERDGALAVSVWRGSDVQVVIARSPQFGPGSQLVLTSRPTPTVHAQED